MVRGSGFIMLHTGSILQHSSSIDSVFKITLKCVFSEGVIVRVFGSDLSLLFTWISGGKKVYKQKFQIFCHCEDLNPTHVDSGNSPQLQRMWDSALRMVSSGFISSESLFGNMFSDMSML